MQLQIKSSGSSTRIKQKDIWNSETKFRVGFEPTTSGFAIPRSATELPKRLVGCGGSVHYIPSRQRIQLCL